MTKKINPFKPNSPVPVGMFAGRLPEIESLEQGLYQTQNGNPQHFLITGERGIGKSSLMQYIRPLAKGDITSPDYAKFNFVTVNTSISDRTGLITLIRLIERGLKRELEKFETIRSFMESTWSFVQRIKIMDSGVEKNEFIDDPDLVIDEFAYSLSETCRRITNPEKGEEAKDGIIFFIDEADNASHDLRIGYFFKTVAEAIQQNGGHNISFIVAGLPELTEKLSTSHESSLRLFTELKVKELKVQDRFYVIDKGIEEANKINESLTEITQSAKEHISTLSEGYPHFIQQFSFSAFETNADGEISDDDVLDGAFKDRGALDAIGARYYASSYYDQIKSDEYRQVLSIMAESMNSWVTKKEISGKFSGSDQTLNNALQALTTRRIILRNTSRRGEYRLQQRGFALWIKMFGERRK
ncbi:AAA family ATPase [Aeromonas caviae]|uniref:AAA family ATPase n=1 Tax=Aeromonas sanarellii TaxID=633415 RepID=UPI0038D199AF